MENEYNKIIGKAAASPEALDDSDIAALRRLFRENPADATAAAILLKYADSHLDEDERKAARARVSLCCGDPAVLIKAIDPSGKGFDSFYPPLPADSRPSTSGAIDIFLETYGKQSDEENALLEKMIFNPVPDYAEQLARQTPAPAAPARNPEQDSRIDSFLNARNADDAAPDSAAQPKRGDAAAEEKTPRKIPGGGSSLLSESLAKIFIRQGRYERAYEIISSISLNYPEKSIYFADQLRFLKKLIINNKYAKRD